MKKEDVHLETIAGTPNRCGSKGPRCRMQFASSLVFFLINDEDTFTIYRPYFIDTQNPSSYTS